jgi:hypothetical protein
MSKSELTRLIILGAGAIVDVGVYPTGAQFIEVAEKLISTCDSELLRNWTNQDECKKQGVESYIKNDIKKYLNNLIRSNHASIDSHISYIKNPAEQNFLKSLIISIILASTAYSELAGSFKIIGITSW